MTERLQRTEDDARSTQRSSKAEHLILIAVNDERLEAYFGQVLVPELRQGIWQ